MTRDRAHTNSPAEHPEATSPRASSRPQPDVYGKLDSSQQNLSFSANA